MYIIYLGSLKETRPWAPKIQCEFLWLVMYCVLLELELFSCYHVKGKVQHMLGLTVGVLKSERFF